MIWGWFVCRSRLVRRGGMVRFVFGVVGFTFICNISNKTVVMVSSIGHSLDTAIRKSNLVRSSNGFAISSLLSVKLSTGVSIGNTVLESIRLGGLIVVGGSMVGCWGMVWGWCSISWGSSGDGDGNSHEGSKSSKAKHDK